MDALIPAGTVARIRRVRDWVIEAQGLDRWGVVGMYGGGGLAVGWLLGAFPANTTLWGPPLMFTGVLSYGPPYPVGVETLPVRPWERSLGVMWARLPRFTLSILLHAVAVVLFAPVLGPVARAVYAVFPQAVAAWDMLTGHPLTVVQGELVFDPSAWRPGVWAARGVAFLTVRTAVRSVAHGTEVRFSPVMFVALFAIAVAPWPAAIAVVLAATVLILGTGGERELGLPLPALRTTPQLRQRPHRVGAWAVARDVFTVVPPREALAGGPMLWALTIQLFLEAMRMWRKGAVGGVLLLLLAVPLVGPSWVGALVLGAPGVPGGGALSGAMETLPIRSRRYVVTRVAQAVTGLLLVLPFCFAADRMGLAVLVVMITSVSLAGTFLDCAVNRGSLVARFFWLAVAVVLLIPWIGPVAVLACWTTIVWVVAWRAARRVLAEVP